MGIKGIDAKIDQFIRAYISRNPLACNKTILNSCAGEDGLHLDRERLYEFTGKLSDVLRTGIYGTDPDNLKRVSTIGLESSIELLSAITNDGSFNYDPELNLLKAVAHYCQPRKRKSVEGPNDSVEEVQPVTNILKEFQKEEQIISEEEALITGASRVEKDSSVPINAGEALSMFTAKKVGK